MIEDHSSKWHLQKFAEFALEKIRVFEPLAHGLVACQLSAAEDLSEKVWRLVLYLNAYSVVGAEVIWNEWPIHRYEELPDSFGAWIQDNFAGIHTRRERRCVRTPKNFVRAVGSLHDWMLTELPRLRERYSNNSEDNYRAWLDSLSKVTFFGRYICATALETFRLAGYTSAEPARLGNLGDHPSPLRGLSMLCPREERPRVIRESADAVGSEIRQEVLQRSGLSAQQLSWFTFAALLCEYRLCYEKGGEYVGNSHDEELSYLAGPCGHYWQQRNFETKIYEARKILFPAECLGEIQGWDGLRPEIGQMLRNEGVVWSDLVYDYRGTAQGGRLLRRGTGINGEHRRPT